MMGDTKIEWAEKVWNPVVGCTKCSPGCLNCYAERMANRQAYMGNANYRRVVKYEEEELWGENVVNKPDFWFNGWNGETACIESALDQPLHWRNPRRIFVVSMGDLFHPSVPFEFIDKVFAVIALCPQHTFLVLTKRVERMLKYIIEELVHQGTKMATHRSWPAMLELLDSLDNKDPRNKSSYWQKGYPLPNIWLGVTVCNQKEADEKIPVLLQIPAAKHFVSFEPLLEGIFPSTLENWEGIDLAIIGCESLNSKAGRFRGNEEDFYRATRNIAHTIKYGLKKSVFVKQLPVNGKVSKDMSEWPADLRLR